MNEALWYWRCRPLRALGLKRVSVRRYGYRAWWVVCRACGRSVLCLKCEDCRWDIAQYPTVAAHVKLLKKLDALAPFRCAKGCNAALCDNPPSPVLVAMAEDAARANVPLSPGRARGPKKVAP